MLRMHYKFYYFPLFPLSVMSTSFTQLSTQRQLRKHWPCGIHLWELTSIPLPVTINFISDIFLTICQLFNSSTFVEVSFFIISSDICLYFPDCSPCLWPSAVSFTQLLWLQCMLPGGSGLEGLTTPTASVFSKEVCCGYRFQKIKGSWEKLTHFWPCNCAVQEQSNFWQDRIQDFRVLVNSLFSITWTHLCLLTSVSCQVLAHTLLLLEVSSRWQKQWLSDYCGSLRTYLLCLCLR